MQRRWRIVAVEEAVELVVERRGAGHQGHVLRHASKLARLADRVTEALGQMRGKLRAAHLAESFGYPVSEPRELARVSPYVALMTGAAPLYDELHKLFDADYPPTPRTGCSRESPRSSAPETIGAAPADRQHELRRLAGTRIYESRRDVRSGDLHLGRGRARASSPTVPDGTPRIIDIPNEYSDLSLERRTIILKIHGAVDRANRRRQLS